MSTTKRNPPSAVTRRAKHTAISQHDPDNVMHPIEPRRPRAMLRPTRDFLRLDRLVDHRTGDRRAQGKLPSIDLVRDLHHSAATALC
jgi:hypothetical protein